MLTAVDAVVMVIDAGKGIETQTRKLFEVCKRRGVPIFTFMNKCDRPTRDPLALIDELESVLKDRGVSRELAARATGPTFRGIYTIAPNPRTVHLFERDRPGASRAPVQIADPLRPSGQGQARCRRLCSAPWRNSRCSTSRASSMMPKRRIMATRRPFSLGVPPRLTSACS